MNDLTFYGDSWEHYTYWQMQDRKTLKILMYCCLCFDREEIAGGFFKNNV